MGQFSNSNGWSREFQYQIIFNLFNRCNHYNRHGIFYNIENKTNANNIKVFTCNWCIDHNHSPLKYYLWSQFASGCHSHFSFFAVSNFTIYIFVICFALILYEWLSNGNEYQNHHDTNQDNSTQSNSKTSADILKKHQSQPQSIESKLQNINISCYFQLSTTQRFEWELYNTS